MKTVYPTAFIFRQEKNIPGVYDRKQFESYQLTMECNVREDGSGGSEATAEEEAKERKNRSNAVLDSSALLRRRKYFNKNLGEIVRQHHKVSILSLPPSLSLSLPSSLLPTLSLSLPPPPLSLKRGSNQLYSLIPPLLPAVPFLTEASAGDP